MSKPAVMILGASGFIGRRLTLHLANQGTPVVAATRQAVEFAHPGVRNIVAPWDQKAQFLDWLPQCEAVVHAASISTPGSSDAQPQLDGNLRTTLALIEALQDNPACRVVFLSSAGALYGERESPAQESDALLPRSYHGAGKVASESFLRAWATQYSGTSVILRPSNVYGPGQPARAGFGIVSAALDCARSGTPLDVWGATSIRDYLFIDDFLALCDASLRHSLDQGTHVFNAASGESLSVADLVDRISSVTGRPIERRIQPERRVDIRCIRVDSRNARSTFGWSPATTLEQGLQQTWQWMADAR